MSQVNLNISISVLEPRINVLLQTDIHIDYMCIDYIEYNVIAVQ